MSLFFAYDGSVHDDWIFRYALALAQAHPERTLELLSVEDGPLTRSALEARLAGLARECTARGVTLRERVVPCAREGAAASLLSAVPRGPEHFLLCGTRVRPRGRGYLAGTVAEALLRARPCQVLAVRVVQPGLLGVPRELLVPVSGHPRGLAAALPFLRLLAPRLERLELLLVKELRRARFLHLDGARAAALRADGLRYLERLEGELRAEPALARCEVQREVVVSDDAPKEIALAAGRLRAQLIVLGASERSLPQRFMFGNPIEQVLRTAPCDVAVYRGPAGSA